MQEDLTPQTTLTVTTVSRPKRVAFLVDSTIPDPTNIDELIRFSSSVWGGRFHAIIPTSGKEIAADWWQLLLALDPDIICSFVPIEDDLLNRINRYILPCEIIEKIPGEMKGGDGRYHADTFSIRALGVEDIPRFIWEARTSSREPHFMYIKDSSANSESSSFILRNFGASAGIISMNEAFRELPHYIVELNSITPEEMMQKILPHARTRRLIFPIDLCHSQVHKHFMLDHQRSVRGFHLIVGDSVLDAIYSWNRGLTSDGYSGRDFFWLSKKLADDDDFLKLVGTWIRHTFWADSPDRFGLVVSYSIDLPDLSKIAKKISSTAMLPFEPNHLAQDQYPFPRIYPPAIDRQPESQTYQVPLSENHCLVGFPRPPFLKSGHPQFGWMVDCWIQYHPERHIWTNARPDWILPKRLGLSNNFFENDTVSRVIHGGLPSVAVTTVDRSINITIPSDRAIIWTCLFNRDYVNTRRERAERTSRFRSIKISDKGQYLQGLIRLFENVYFAGYTFEDPFWRYVLLKMAGRSPNVKNERSKRKEIILDEFNKIFASDASPLEANSPRLERVVNELAGRLLFRDTAPIIFTQKNIADLFGHLRSKNLKIQPPNDYWQGEQFKESKLQELLNRRVILQGAELTCPFCRTKQWYYVDNLLSEMRCNGCQIEFPLPMTPEWSFRLNDLALNALKRHGTLAVLHALYQLLHFMGGMFLFLPCQDIFESDKKEPFTDLDLIYIHKGKFIIGEVKSSPEAFKRSDFDKLIDVAKDVLPDEIIIAAQGDQWPEKIDAEIKEFTKTVRSIEIKVTPTLLRWHYGD